ncbi:MAG: endonuclease domain-containing protein [bacterium]|nr:endonuclease domain-containing protein [bacterium]
MKLHYVPQLKVNAANLRKAENLAEVLLWQEIKSSKLGVRFLRQRPIGNYIVDFYCHALNLAIEVDGASHDSKVTADEKRQQILESKGVRFIRFLDRDVRYNLDSVLLEIQSYLKSLHA